MEMRGRLNRVVHRGFALAGVAFVAETAAQVITAIGPLPTFGLPASVEGFLTTTSLGGLFPTTWAATLVTSILLISGPALSRGGPNLGPKIQPRQQRSVLRRRRSAPSSGGTYVRLERLLLPGERVYHPTFGTGIVTSLIRSGEDLEIRVAFDGRAVERFLAANQPTAYPVIEGGLGRISAIPDSSLRPAA